MRSYQPDTDLPTEQCLSERPLGTGLYPLSLWCSGGGGPEQEQELNGCSVNFIYGLQANRTGIQSPLSASAPLTEALKVVFSSPTVEEDRCVDWILPRRRLLLIPHSMTT